MLKLRSLFAVVLALVATVLVACSSGPAAKVATTYTPDRLAKIEMYAIPVNEARQGLQTLQRFVEAENWVDVRTYIHGPLGLLRRDLRYLADILLPQDAAKANDLAVEIAGHLEKLDAAAQDKNSGAAATQYNEAKKDFDAFLTLVPAGDA